MRLQTFVVVSCLVAVSGPASAQPTPEQAASAVPAPRAPFTRSAPSRPAWAAGYMHNANVVCSNYQTVMGGAAYPRDALRQGLSEGSALIQFTVTIDGSITNVRTVQASHPIFAEAAMEVVRQYRCRGQGSDVVVRVPFGYSLE